MANSSARDAQCTWRGDKTQFWAHILHSSWGWSFLNFLNVLQCKCIVKMIFIETLHIPSKLCSHFHSTLSSQIVSVMLFQVTKWASLLWGSDQHPATLGRCQRTYSDIKRASSDHREDSERRWCGRNSVWLEVRGDGAGQAVPDHLHPVHGNGHHPAPGLGSPCDCNLVAKTRFTHVRKICQQSRIKINQFWNRKSTLQFKMHIQISQYFLDSLINKSFLKFMVTRNYSI